MELSYFFFVCHSNLFTRHLSLSFSPVQIKEQKDDRKKCNNIFGRKKQFRPISPKKWNCFFFISSSSYILTVESGICILQHLKDITKNILQQHFNITENIVHQLLWNVHSCNVILKRQSTNRQIANPKFNTFLAL
jgi:hypothetical protein